MSPSVTKKNGFGIIEVLLAGVIIITMLGALVVLGKTVISNLTNTAQRSQATFLAQQGIEIVRQIRDSNYIDQDNTTQWNSLITDSSGSYHPPSFGSGDIYVISFNYNSPTIKPKLIKLADDSAGDSDIPLVGGGTFTRTISFQKVTNLQPQGATASLDENNVFTVKCTVDWEGGKEVTIDEMLTNSHPNF
jgi:type II secretory pathway pseudopilin PulG